jgi:hypothetical protein
MTEEGFWDLAEEGARVIVLTMQWLLVWPFLLLGLAARLYAGSKPLVETTEELARCEAREPDHVHPKAGQHD